MICRRGFGIGKRFFPQLEAIPLERDLGEEESSGALYPRFRDEATPI